MTRDHGGNLDAAVRAFSGKPENWLDLSTGINPRPYPLPELSSHAWNALPTKSDQAHLIATVQSALNTAWPALATAGAQAGIQMVPRLLPTGRARVIGPTYNEHAASLRAAGWEVTTVPEITMLGGADLSVVVNPNNPDGTLFSSETLMSLATQVGTLIIDESFCDPHPGNSVLAQKIPSNVIVMRSFGKFFGLAGVRLGFTFASQNFVDQLSELSGPWPVSGPALEIGRVAYSDKDWQTRTIARLEADATRMDDLARAHGWGVVGGTTLFRLYETPNALEAQNMLARHHIWSRIFPYSDTWIRLGLPDGSDRWEQLEGALAR